MIFKHLVINQANHKMWFFQFQD